MAFLKQRIGDEAPVDLHALGIDSSQVPGEDWYWAIDVERKAFFTQLVGTAAEMREADYWYALVFDGFASVLYVDGQAGTRVDGRLHLKARFVRLPPHLGADALPHLQTLAQEAMMVLSLDSDGLDFAHGAR